MHLAPAASDFDPRAELMARAVTAAMRRAESVMQLKPGAIEFARPILTAQVRLEHGLADEAVSACHKTSDDGTTGRPATRGFSACSTPREDRLQPLAGGGSEEPALTTRASNAPARPECPEALSNGTGLGAGRHREAAATAEHRGLADGESDAVAPGGNGALSTSERVGMPCGPSERGERSGSSLVGSPSSQQLEPFQAIRMVGSGGPQPATREIETRREPASVTAGVLCGEIEDRLGFMAPDGACATPPPATAPIGEKAAPDGLPREKPAMRPGDLGDRAFDSHADQTGEQNAVAPGAYGALSTTSPQGQDAAPGGETQRAITAFGPEGRTEDARSTAAQASSDPSEHRAPCECGGAGAWIVRHRSWSGDEVIERCRACKGTGLVVR